MEPRPAHTFNAFRLEPPPGGLWRGDTRIALRPRPLAVLRYLGLFAQSPKKVYFTAYVSFNLLIHMLL
jgi:hypothetical protein